MERFQHGSLLKLKRKSGQAVWAFRWYEQSPSGRVYRKKIIGSVADLPNRKDAEKEIASLRVRINSKVFCPETVDDLATHYFENELTLEHKAFSTVETNGNFIKLYVLPKWGDVSLSAVRTVEVEKWLSSVPLAPASRSKIKAVFSALFGHAIRHEWVTHNPIRAVRCSAKRLREKDVLTPGEFVPLLNELSVRETAMVMLIGSTGLRRSEFIGLQWSDLNTERMEIKITKSCVRNRFGETKTEGSAKPVPLHPLVLKSLMDWRQEAPYAENADFIFASLRLKGAKPLSPDTLLKKVIRPALERAGIKGKVIGWHSFRHSLATYLLSLGVGIKTVQELMRHASPKITLDLYAHGVSAEKHEATGKVVTMLLPEKKAS